MSEVNIKMKFLNDGERISAVENKHACKVKKKTAPKKERPIIKKQKNFYGTFVTVNFPVAKFSIVAKFS